MIGGILGKKRIKLGSEREIKISVMVTMASFST